MTKRSPIPINKPDPVENGEWIPLSKGFWALVDKEEFDRLTLLKNSSKTSLS